MARACGVVRPSRNEGRAVRDPGTRKVALTRGNVSRLEHGNGIHRTRGNKRKSQGTAYAEPAPHERLNSVRKDQLTPHSLAFYVDVVTSGTVLGAKPTDSPDRVTAILGSDFAENSLNDHIMWRDYGMAEFSWVRESPDSPWEGHHFTLQVHRLSHWGGSIVNTSDVRITNSDGWISVSADLDWLAEFEEAVFSQMVPFPPGGPNGITAVAEVPPGSLPAGLRPSWAATPPTSDPRIVRPAREESTLRLNYRRRRTSSWEGSDSCGTGLHSTGAGMDFPGECQDSNSGSHFEGRVFTGPEQPEIC